MKLPFYAIVEKQVVRITGINTFGSNGKTFFWGELAHGGPSFQIPANMIDTIPNQKVAELLYGDKSSPAAKTLFSKKNKQKTRT